LFFKTHLFMLPIIDRLVHETLLGEALVSAYEQGGCAVVVSDDDGNILAANQATVRLLGYSLDELRALHAREIVGRTDFNELQPIYTQLMRGEQVFAEAILKRKDGVIGTIKYRAMNAKVGPLPVLVSITHEVSTFTPLRSSEIAVAVASTGGRPCLCPPSPCTWTCAS
jgi:PAS domain S-box-containing protein